ncbi:MAG: putative Fe-S cluster assembly protein SufT [Candidatus Omnitrophica bacterium]|nr:putative Fe-S cluster assembly protein SufT [Candidatus Omnitrophota bacterium]
MQMNESAVLIRDLEATQIPSGTKMTLFKDTHVTITQALGGTYTVMTDQGVLASIAGKDADAIGKEVINSPMDTMPEASTEDLVMAQLRTCYDPEIPHNIVDLGLIYECKITPVEEEGREGQKVDIRMSLTAPGCGMGDWLRQDIKNKLQVVPGIKEVNVEVTFDPPWNPSMMNPALRRALNMM